MWYDILDPVRDREGNGVTSKVFQRLNKSTVSRRAVLRSSAVAGAAGLTGISTTVAASAPSEADDQSSESDPQLATGGNGMVVSDNPHASNIGAAVLRDGGNAIDAVVAVHLAVEAVNPQSLGIGGGGTMMYYDAAEDDVLSLDFYPRAPEAATPEYWIDEDGTPLPDATLNSSGLSVGVPGTVEGLTQAHRRFGDLPWERLVTPVIDLARGGFVYGVPEVSIISG